MSAESARMRRVRWLLILVLASALLPAGAAAGEPLSLDEAVELALEHSRAIALARLALKEAELKAQQVILGGASVSPQERESAEESVRSARTGLADAIDNAVLTVEERYYAVLQAERALGLAERADAKAAREYEIASLRFEEGLISAMQFGDASRQRQQSELNLLEARQNLEASLRSFNQALGIDLETKWRLESRGGAEPPGDELRRAEEIAFELRADWRRAQEALEKRIEELAQARNPFTSAVELSLAELAVERARVELEQVRAQVALEVQNAVRSVQSAWQQVEHARQNVQLAEENYAVERARYDAGLTSELALEDARTGVIRAEADEAAAVESYRLAWKRFLRTLGMQLMEADPQ